MTVEEIRETVADIKRIKDDDETAHSREDTLYISVLEHIAHGCEGAKAKALARAALLARKIKFARWCA